MYGSWERVTNKSMCTKLISTSGILDPHESTPDGISIGSAVFEQLTRMPNTHRQTDRLTDHTFACSDVEVYSVGSEEELELAVAVENRGEDAFEATVRIFTPPDVDYVSVGDIAAPVSTPVTFVPFYRLDRPRAPSFRHLKPRYMGRHDSPTWAHISQHQPTRQPTLWPHMTGRHDGGC